MIINKDDHISIKNFSHAKLKQAFSLIAESPVESYPLDDYITELMLRAPDARYGALVRAIIYYWSTEIIHHDLTIERVLPETFVTKVLLEDRHISACEDYQRSYRWWKFWRWHERKVVY